MAVTIIWQYDTGDAIPGEAQDLGSVAAGSDSTPLVMFGHYETDISVVLLTEVGFYISPYDGLYTGDFSAHKDYYDLLAFGDIHRGATNNRGFLINQRGYELPEFPAAGLVSCHSERGSNPDNAIELLLTAVEPNASNDGELPLGSVIKMQVMISLPSLTRETGVRQISMYITFSYTI